ncbi:MAG TPA: acetyl-CoA carboxylase biotin carboxyl carrier protein, partial [Pyrinomonadaceae bacterium]|nr:acetyl-CoA carboxylase biotin carboxyl carrier protein [Pyrinomonadaceae bacterium]
SAAPPAQAQAEAPAAATEATAEAPAEDLHIITSPIVGTFYRSPSPNAEPFVKAGSAVEPDTVVCIIEAMKLMNEIQAETAGTVEKIYVENGQPVEYGQPLFGVKR